MAFTKVTCVYAANSFGATPNVLAALLDKTNVPVDPGTLEVWNLTVESDTTIFGATKAVRTIVLDFSPTFTASFPDASDQRAVFWNFMTGLLQAAARSPVVAAAPVLS
jgi:hypothetical protein